MYVKRSLHRAWGVRAIFVALTLSIAGCSAGSSGAVAFSLGTAQLQASGSGSVSVDFVPGAASPVTATTRDQRGYSWTLTLPPKALTTRAEVTLSTLSTISAPSALSVATGVRVLPAGLVFGEPATLSVQAPTGLPAIVGYYLTAGSGATINFGDPTSSGALRLFGSFMALGSTRAASASVTKSGLAAALDAVPDTSNVASLSPPSVPFSCDAATLRYDPAVNSYVLAAEQPTRASILNLLATLDTGALSGTFANPAKDKTAKKARQTLGDLSDALVRQAEKQVTAASDDGAANVPLTALVTSVQELRSAIGGQPDAQLSEQITAWTTALHAKYCPTS